MRKFNERFEHTILLRGGYNDRRAPVPDRELGPVREGSVKPNRKSG